MTASQAGGPPVVDGCESAVVGGQALIGGAAAVVLLRLVPANWRAWLRDAKIAGPEREQVEQALRALECVAAGWRASLAASASGNIRAAAEGQGKSGPPELRPWIASSEAAGILGVTARRVRQLAAEGAIPSIREGGRLLLDREQVAALRRLRDSYERRLTGQADG